MSIEFIGLPGTGKSRVCDDLIPLLHESALHADRMAFFPAADKEPRVKVLLNKVLRASLFVAFRPITAVRTALLIKATGVAPKFDAFTKTLNLLAVFWREEWYRERVPVFEQGVLQGVWSLVIRAERPNVRDLMQLASPYLPDMVIHLETDHEEISRRIEKRLSEHSWVDRLSSEDQAGQLQQSEQHFAEIIETWKRHVPNHVYRKFRNSQGDRTDEIASQICELITSEWSKGSIWQWTH